MRIKSRNVLIIISYNGIRKEDLWDTSQTNSEWSPLLQGAVQRKLVTVEDFEREKMADEQKQKEIGEKKQKKKELR